MCLKCQIQTTFLASTKNESWWPTNPLEKPYANSKHYSFTLKIVTGGMKFPVSFVQAIIVVSSSFHTSAVQCMALLPYSVQGFFWWVYYTANTLTHQHFIGILVCSPHQASPQSLTGKYTATSWFRPLQWVSGRPPVALISNSWVTLSESLDPTQTSHFIIYSKGMFYSIWLCTRDSNFSDAFKSIPNPHAHFFQNTSHQQLFLIHATYGLPSLFLNIMSQPQCSTVLGQEPETPNNSACC